MYLQTFNFAPATTYAQLVDRIHCQTEELLAEVEDSEEAYGLLKVRAGR